MIKVNIKENGLSEIHDETLEENGWIIAERFDHTWDLYDSVEWYLLDPDKKPFKNYRNHELGEAIIQAKKWT
jgi:hypothetical protein